MQGPCPGSPNTTAHAGFRPKPPWAHGVWGSITYPGALSPTVLSLRLPRPLKAQSLLQTCPGSPAGGQDDKFCFVSK